MDQIAVAPNEMVARDLSDQLWQIWTTAPDEAAQEMLGRGMQRRGSFDFVGALKDFSTLIAYCPNYAEGYNQRAFVHFLKEDFPAALIDLDRALELVPDHIGAVSGRALTLLGMGRDKDGQAALQDALKLNPWLSERHLLNPQKAEETEL